MTAISNNETIVACAILCLLAMSFVAVFHILTIRKSEQVAKQTSSDLFKEKVAFYTRTIDTLVEQLNESNRIIDKAIHYIENDSKEPEKLVGIGDSKVIEADD